MERRDGYVGIVFDILRHKGEMKSIAHVRRWGPGKLGQLLDCA